MMADAKKKEAWNRTSNLMAIVHNAHAVKGDQMQAEDFNPFANTEEELEYLPPKETNDILKSALGIE